MDSLAFPGLFSFVDGCLIVAFYGGMKTGIFYSSTILFMSPTKFIL